MAHSRRAFVQTISIATIATTGVLAFLKKISLLSIWKEINEASDTVRAYLKDEFKKCWKMFVLKNG